MPDEPDASLQELQDRAARYDSAGAIARAALKIVNQAPDRIARERLRRHHIGVEGRIAEDVVRLVESCDPVWELLAEKGLPPDLSRRELTEIRDSLVGRRSERHVLPSVSLRLHDDEVHVSAVRNLIPSLETPHEIDGYRYATWADVERGRPEPFVLALAQVETGVHTVVATMFLGATFLRYEQELGAVSRAQLNRLARAITADRRLITRTHAALAQV